MSKALVRTLREDYPCMACGAARGEPCRTIRHHPGRPRETGRITQPHQSRWDQYHADQLSGDLIQAIREPKPTDERPFVTTEADIAKALEPEGWGTGFSASLAQRIVKRLKENA